MAGFKGSLMFIVLLFLSKSLADIDTDFGEDAKFGQQDDIGEDETFGKQEDNFGENGDDQFFGTDEEFNNVHYANDAHEGSGEDDDNIFIPVEPKKPVLPKSRPKPEPKDPEPETITESAEVEIEQTSFQPVEFHFKHKYPVYTGEQSTVHPGGQEGDEPVTEGEPLPEEEAEAKPEEQEETVKPKAVNVNTEHFPPGKKPEDQGQGEGHDQGHNDLVDNGHHDYNGTDIVVGQTTKHSRNNGLSNIAKIGIAMGCVVVFWLLLCPIVCIVCRRRDKKREKRAEDFKLKNGVPHHQHPLVDELVLTELGQNEKHYSNGKQKLYGNDVQNAEELQPMKNQANGSHHSNHGDVVTKKPFLGHAPLASQEALDTEV